MWPSVPVRNRDALVSGTLQPSLTLVVIRNVAVVRLVSCSSEPSGCVCIDTVRRRAVVRTLAPNEARRGLLFFFFCDDNTGAAQSLDPKFRIGVD